MKVVVRPFDNSDYPVAIELPKVIFEYMEAEGISDKLAFMWVEYFVARQLEQ